MKKKEEKKIEIKKLSTKEQNNFTSLYFQSDNKLISHSLLCYENDIFPNISKKVFEEKPEFKKYGNIFLYKKNQINENKSLKGNKIKDHNAIIVKKKEKNLNQIEENKLKYSAKNIKNETNIDAIICAKSTKNILVFKLFSNNESIKYFIISDENSIFNENISKVYMS